MSKTISILNYNLGNIYSIKNAAQSVGFEVKVITTPEEIATSERLILPGVGAYIDAMSKLKTDELDKAIKEFTASGKSILGICLGMQLLFEYSEEGGHCEGLNLLKGTVKKFPTLPGYKIPQIQWNKVKFSPRSLLSTGLNKDYFYFLHSYYVDSKMDESTISRSNYCELDYCCAIEYKNIMGVQFHPEKSGETGLRLLHNFFKFGE